ncbi:hypothetical protein PY254_16340 [Rhodanobacter sp. AS-Z3]|uniref:hypothetical protein n=1 Tax=Rhodanobacter sp. AS-Z3 TaxID=3031330 RepID=UPI002478B687|nr:hypothetical protein [Rhodanobacter sp. AS-Z3]WEN14782.1 hypothetical protein PY254_16340 [Rhodanobacter sp. AS-Z3]
MPAPHSNHQRAANPAQVMLSSPLAAATRARVYHQRTRPRPRERVLRIVAMVGAMLVHLIFLFGFVLGPAFQVVLPPESKPALLQVRLIELPEPPPPPPVRGTPPKERGPRHQGRSSRAAAVSERSANIEAVVAPAPPAVIQPPVVTKVARVKAPAPKPVAAPPKPVSLPKPAPTPELQPIPLAGEPPVVALPTPVVAAPVPPKFQPESVRKPQLEGNQPMPPPASLAMPEVPPQAAPPLAPPTIALDTTVPKSSAPASVAPMRAELPAAPPVPELQAVPLPAQSSPIVNLQAPLSTPSPVVPNEKPQVQAPAIEVAEAELEAVPLAPAAPSKIAPQTPSAKVEVNTAARPIAVQPSIERPQLSAPTALADAAPTPDSTEAKTAASTPDASNVANPPTTPTQADDTPARDVSRAPDATPQGSDLGDPGKPDGTDRASADASSTAKAAEPAKQQGLGKQAADHPSNKLLAGQSGGNQPGASQGAREGSLEGDSKGELGGYVQLKPHGDTQVMRHGTPNIGYQPTRFEQDWAPEGESSVDTALRRAVEKTRVSHTFHLPRGIRVKCAVTPLLPIALFGCTNPDPPAKPLDQKIYDRLNLAPANPVATPTPAAASSVKPTPLVKFDNTAECAAARVAGSPPPPGCEVITLPVKPATPASSSTSWVPASDQFH